MMSNKDRPVARYECYVNVQKSDGVNGQAIIIFGNGDTAKEARELFDHAMTEYLEKLKDDK